MGRERGGSRDERGGGRDEEQASWQLGKVRRERGQGELKEGWSITEKVIPLEYAVGRKFSRHENICYIRCWTHTMKIFIGILRACAPATWPVFTKILICELFC